MEDGEDFAIKDCALIAIATGTRVQTLRGLRDSLLACHPGCIYYHFWGGLLHSRFEQREYNNDFAAWTAHWLHDKILGERLGVIDPSAFSDIEVLRRELVESVEQRLDEVEYLAWASPDQQFEFIRSQIVVFDTGKRIAQPGELAGLVPQLSAGSIFYHFIDARRRSASGCDDFRAWLQGFGARYAELDAGLAAIDPYFVSLTELRCQIADIVGAYFGRKNNEPA